jgi:hypothetical protein
MTGSSTLSERLVFAPVRRWMAAERQALRYVHGRVLDSDAARDGSRWSLKHADVR